MAGRRRTERGDRGLRLPVERGRRSNGRSPRPHRPAAPYRVAVYRLGWYLAWGRRREGLAQPPPGLPKLTFPVGFEYSLLQFMERNGFPLEYVTDIYVDEHPQLLLEHPLTIALGHGEYWSQGIRAAWDGRAVRRQESGVPRCGHWLLADSLRGLAPHDRGVPVEHARSRPDRAGSPPRPSQAGARQRKTPRWRFLQRGAIARLRLSANQARGVVSRPRGPQTRCGRCREGDWCHSRLRGASEQWGPPPIYVRRLRNCP